MYAKMHKYEHTFMYSNYGSVARDDDMGYVLVFFQKQFCNYLKFKTKIEIDEF